MTSKLPSHHQDASQGSASGQPTAHATTSTKLTDLTLRLKNSLRQFPDFPEKGVLFEDICPIFRDPARLADLINALELFTAKENGGPGRPDIVVGLDARGFLLGPSLALRLDSGFVPVRKRGKLPGPTESATYQKEYGKDVFEIQADAIAPGQKVIVLDDIIATGVFRLVTIPSGIAC